MAEVRAEQATIDPEDGFTVQGYPVPLPESGELDDPAFLTDLVYEMYVQDRFPQLVSAIGLANLRYDKAVERPGDGTLLLGFVDAFLSMALLVAVSTCGTNSTVTPRRRPGSSQEPLWSPWRRRTGRRVL